jgi:hypothetical protein
VTRFIYRLYTPHGATSTGKAIADFHTSQIASVLAKLFQLALFFLPAVPWQRILRVEILQLYALRSSCHSRPRRILVNCQLNYSAISSKSPLQSSSELVAPIPLFITPRDNYAENTACNNLSIFVRGLLGFLCDRYSVSPLGQWLLSSNGYCLVCFEVCPATGLRHNI